MIKEENFVGISSSSCIETNDPSMLVASFHPFFWGKKQLFSHISAAPKSYSYPSPATSQNLHSSLIMMIMTHPSVHPKKKFGPFLIIRISVSNFLRKWGGPALPGRTFWPWESLARSYKFENCCCCCSCWDFSQIPNMLELFQIY